MMINLFSTFDPSTSTNISMNWMSLFFPLLFYPWMYWITSSQHSSLYLIISNKIYKELNSMKIHMPKGSILMLFSIMWSIMIINSMGLLPYVFTASSHLIMTIPMALSLWLSINLYGWLINTKHMLSHTLPLGTPMLLSSFMICIETISNIIRPLTLAVRLSANMIAGHLLIALISSTMQKNILVLLLLITPIEILLLILETAVALIQSYVFMTLVSLYLGETN